MDHQEARELLEEAAVEPSGFERLAAGDTPEAAALVSHLAGCPECTMEYEALGRDAATIREVVRELPPVDLKERTLARIAALGRAPVPLAAPAGAMSGAAAVDVVEAPRPVTTASTDMPSAPERAAGDTRSSRASRGRAWWPALSMVAVLVAAIGIGGWWNASNQLDQEQAVSSELAEINDATLQIQAQPDDQLIALAATAKAPGATGTMTYSPSAHELVVVATGLAVPATGTSYRCWLEIAGVRTDIGPMHLGGGKAYWAGWDSAADGLQPGATFGVAIAVSPNVATDASQDVLTGQL